MFEKVKIYARWAIVIPGAVVGSLVAYLLIGTINRFGSSSAGVNLDSLFSRVYFQASDGLVLGAAFVLTGTIIAPSHQKHAAVVLSALGLLFVGGSMVLGITQKNYWSIFQGVFAAVGAGAAAYSVQQHGHPRLWEGH